MAQRTEAIVQGHNQELARIEYLVALTRNQQVADGADPTQLNADVAQVGQYATQLADEVTSLHNTAVGNERSICATLNAVVTDLGIHTSCSVAASAG